MKLYDAAYLQQDGRDGIPDGFYWFKSSASRKWAFGYVHAANEELQPCDGGMVSFLCGDMHALYGPIPNIPFPPEA